MTTIDTTILVLAASLPDFRGVRSMEVLDQLASGDSGSRFLRESATPADAAADRDRARNNIIIYTKREN